MRHTVLFLTIVLVIAAIDTGANAAAVRVASVDYVDNATITLESTLNRLTQSTLTPLIRNIHRRVPYLMH